MRKVNWKEGTKRVAVVLTILAVIFWIGWSIILGDLFSDLSNALKRQPQVVLTDPKLAQRGAPAAAPSGDILQFLTNQQNQQPTMPKAAPVSENESNLGSNVEFLLGAIAITVGAIWVLYGLAYFIVKGFIRG